MNRNPDAQQPAAAADDLVERCTRESLRLLEDNLTPRGVLAARRGAAAEARSYTRIFGRDAGVCALAMIGSGVPSLEQGAVASLDALAALQAPNGQIPKYVDPDGKDADFWYLGCIDATLWWLIAVDHARRAAPTPAGGARWQGSIERALQWLLAQEHQRFFLLQQNEASDWADIMPRSGFVLYTNALWYLVKRRFGLPRQDETRHHFNHLFHPFSRDLPDYRRGRLLRHYAVRGRHSPGLYLSFVNLSFAGDEGDVFGNVLAILCGLAGDARANEIVKTLLAAGVADPYPVRVTIQPITREHELWRGYMERHRQNHPHQYHNGGLWPFVGGFWVLALAMLGMTELSRGELSKLARVNSLDGWRFTEWFHGRTLAPMGMAGQSWNAATYLLAQRALGRGESVFSAHDQHGRGAMR
ncbi:MAG: amylo-alpha-1,6-glucosidase [Gemmatimonadota bacterium]